MTLDDLRTCPRAALTVTEVAALLDVDERTVRRACEDQQLPAIHVGRRILLPTARLLALLDTPEHSESASATDAPIATTSAEEERHHECATPLPHAV